MIPAEEPKRFSWGCLVPLAALVAVLLVVFVWHPWLPAEEPLPEEGSQDGQAQSAEDRGPTVEQTLSAYPAYTRLSPTDFKTVEGTGVFGFTLSGLGTPPVMSEQAAARIDEAMEPFDKAAAPVSFLLMDMGTGRGFACNIDEKIYGASSFKGPYSAYVLQDIVESGQAGLDDSVRSGEMTEDGGFFFSGSDTLSNLLSDTVVYSSNDAFAALRNGYSDDALALWLQSLDVDPQMARGEWFPFYSVRDAAALWTDVYAYLESGTEEADFLSKLYGKTEVSFLRDALVGPSDEGAAGASVAEGASGNPADVGGGATAGTETEEASAEPSDGDAVMVEHFSDGAQVAVTMAQSVSKGPGQIEIALAPDWDVSVRDKAGWYADPDDADYNAMVDNGIVTCNGRDYLMCLMTGLSYTERNERSMERLALAVFAAHEDLA